MLRTDESLDEWFVRRKARDEQLSQALTSMAVPAGLRERLLNLEAAPVSATAGQRPKGNAWSRRETLLAVAATVVIGTSAVLWRVLSPQEAGWQSQALAVVTRLDSGKMPLDHVSNDMADIQAYLRAAGSPVPQAGDIPPQLNAHRRVGCKTFKVNGKPATVVCFEMSSGLLAHIVVIDTVAKPSEAPLGHPLFAASGAWHTASWTDGTKTYMIGTRAEMEKLVGLFG